MIKKILTIIGAVISVLVVGLYFTYDYWLEKKLKSHLSEIINKEPSNLYKYSFENLNIHLMEGSVDLNGITIIPTVAGYDSLAKEANGIRFLVRINMEKIEMNGFEITEFLTTGIITIKSLIVSEPKLEYLFHPRKIKTRNSLPLNSLFTDKFKEANLGQLLIKDASIIILDNTKSVPAIKINHLTFELSKAHIDSITILRFSPFDYEDIKVTAGGINIDATEDFSIESDSLIFSAINESISIRNFQLKPKFNQKNFANKYAVQKQWFAIKLGGLVLKQIDFNEFLNSGKVKIGKVEILSPNIALYKDKSKPLPPFKKKLLPATAIKSIPWVIDIDTISIKDGYVTINETSPLTGADSRLTFDELNGVLYNFSNSEDVKQKTKMRLSVSTMVMGKAKTSMNIVFDLGSKIDQFKVTGTIGKVEGAIFNSVLEPMMGVKVTSGTMNKIDFSFTSNDTLSTGTLDADYKGIKIEVLNTDSTKQRKKGFMSLAANTVVKSNNSRTQGNYIQGIINAPRVLDKDVWPYLWHSIQSGLISTLAPITNSKDARLQQKAVRKELRKKRKDKK